MLLLAILTVLLAYEPQRGVIYLGLAVATLVIAMLWEAPEPRPQRTWSGEPNVELPAAR
jgi:hypothetical protein